MSLRAGVAGVLLLCFMPWMPVSALRLMNANSKESREGGECFPASVASKDWLSKPEDFMEESKTDSGVAELSQFLTDRSGCVMFKKTEWKQRGIDFADLLGLNKPGDKCRQCWLTFDGEFQAKKGFQPGKECQCKEEESRLSPKPLLGKTIAFVGDSLARQVMLRMIALFRGEEQVFDHYFHNDAEYKFTAGGDCLHIGSSSDTPCDDTKGQKTGVLKFVWAPFEQQSGAIPTVEKLLAEGHLDAIVVSSGYWFNDETMSLHVKNNAAKPKHAALIKKMEEIPTFFLTIPPLSGGDMGAKDYSRMNHKTREQVSHNPAWKTIDFEHLAALAESKSPRNQKDGMHFQCGVGPMFQEADGQPLQIKALRGGDDPVLDCHDPVNLALARALLLNLS